MAAAPAAARLDRLPQTRSMQRVILLVFLSWLVESYDIGLTGSVLPSLVHQWHLTSTTEVFASIAANLGIVIGIVPAGRLADRLGRRPVLVVGTAAYAVLTCAAGLAPDLAWFVGLRIAGGLAMGAVFPLPYVLATELCPPDRRGRLTGYADAFLSIGYLLSPLLATALVTSVADPTGWRVMMFLGATPVLFALAAWRWVPESPRWLESHGRAGESDAALERWEAQAVAETGRPLPPLAPATAGPAGQRPGAPGGPGSDALRAVLAPTRRSTTLMLWTTFGGTFFIFYSVQTFMPTVISHMGFTLTSSFAFTAVIVGVSLPGKLVESRVVERWGRRPVIIGFTSVAAVAAVAFGFQRGAVAVLAVGCVLSFFGLGVDPAVKVYTAESYPTELRAAGTATTEGFGRLISGVIGPAFIPGLLSSVGVASVYALVGGVAAVAVVVVAVAGRETRGLTLEEVAARVSRPVATPAGVT